MRKLSKQWNLKPNRISSIVLNHECAIFSQTTSVTRVGGPGGLLKVRVEIDKIGDLKLKISDLFGGRKIIGNFFFIFEPFFQIEKIHNLNWIDASDNHGWISFNNDIFLQKNWIKICFFFNRKHSWFLHKQYVATWFSVRSAAYQWFGFNRIHRHIQRVI